MLKKFNNEILNKIAKLRKAEIEISKNLTSDGKSKEAVCYDGSIYICKVFHYNKSIDVEYKKYKANLTSKLDETFNNIGSPIMEVRSNITGIVKKMKSKYIKYDPSNNENIKSTLKSYLFPFSGYGNFQEYLKIIGGAKVALASTTSFYNGGRGTNVTYKFGAWNIYSDVFGLMYDSLNEIDGLIKPSNRYLDYFNGDKVSYGYTYKYQHNDGTIGLYRSLVDKKHGESIQENKTKGDWVYEGNYFFIDKNTMKSALPGDKHIKIIEDGRIKHRLLFEHGNGSLGQGNWEQSPGNDYYRFNWKYLGYLDSIKDQDWPTLYWKAKKWRESGLKVGDIVVTSINSSGGKVSNNAFFRLERETPSGGYPKLPLNVDGNKYWSFLGNKHPRSQTWQYGAEGNPGGYPPPGGYFQALFPKYSTNRKIKVKYGHFLDSIYLEWKNPTTNKVERSIRFGGEGGTAETEFKMDFKNKITIYYGRNQNVDSISGLDRYRGSYNSRHAVEITGLCEIIGIKGRSGSFIDKLGFFNKC